MFELTIVIYPATEPQTFKTGEAARGACRLGRPIMHTNDHGGFHGGREKQQTGRNGTSCRRPAVSSGLGGRTIASGSTSSVYVYRGGFSGSGLQLMADPTEEVAANRNTPTFDSANELGRISAQNAERAAASACCACGLGNTA